MKSNETNPTDTISVVANTSTNIKNLVSSAVELAKSIDADISILYTKSLTEVVKGDNQLSAMRTLHSDNRGTEATIKSIITELKTEDGPIISYEIAYGKDKDIVRAYLDKVKPHTVVMGKQKKRLLSKSTSTIASLVMSQKNTNILFINGDQTLPSVADIVLGVYGNISETKVFSNLKERSNQRVKHFSIRGKQDSTDDEDVNNLVDAVSFVFTEGSNVIDNLVAYVKRANIELFCISNASDRTKQIVQKLNVPVLVMG